MMTTTSIGPATGKPGIDPPQAPAKAASHSVESAQAKAKQPAFPPCLVNLLLDPYHPSRFELTAGRLEVIRGAPGSCLDEFKTHVAATCGTDAFLRAMASIDGGTATALFAKALAASGRAPDAALAGDLARMAGEACVILLEDRIASAVCAKLEANASVCSILAGDPAMRRLLLAHVSGLAGDDAKQLALQGFGLSPGKADSVAALVSAWIPDEITSPTAQSEADVARADAILVKGLEKTARLTADLVPEIRLWQIGKEIDPLADLGPELDAAFSELGIPPAGGSVLHRAIAEHLGTLSDDRETVEVVKVAVDLICDLGSKGVLPGLVGAVPGILMEKKHLDDLVLLEGLGSVDHEAVKDARIDLWLSVAQAAVGAAKP
jgi:hypothetical protein